MTPRALKYVRFDRIEDHFRAGWMASIPNAPMHHHWYGIELAWLCDCPVPGGFKFDRYPTAFHPLQQRASMSEIQPGHNSNEQLKSVVERIERLEEQKQEIASDIRDVYAEGKGNGFDVKALRTIVRMRKQSPDDRAEQDAILETYMHALGMA